MHFKGAVAEDIECYPLLNPRRQLLRPCCKKWIIDFHERVADIAQKGEISSDGYLQWKVGFAFASLEDLFFSGRADSDRPCIQHDPCYLVLCEQRVQREGVWLYIKIGVAYLYRQTRIRRPEVEKSLELCKLSRSKGGRELQEHWTKAGA